MKKILLFALLSVTAIGASVRGQVVMLTDPEVFSEQATVIDFREPAPFVEVANVYHGLGVLFSAQGLSVPETRVVELAPTIPPSTDRVVRNIARDGTSANAALVIHFDYPVRRVGVTLGNGDAATVATMEVFSPQGRSLGNVQQEGVDPTLGPFVGIETLNSEGISTLLLSYGADEAEEQISDLRFDLLSPRPFVTYIPQIATGTAGDLRLEMTLQVQNLLGQLDEAEVRFLTPQGAPMQVLVEGEATDSIRLELPRLGARIIRLGGGNPLQSGYARVESNRPLEAQAIYQVYRDGVLISEAGVASAQARLVQLLALERERASELDTGLAVSNPNSQRTTVSFFFLDQETLLVELREFELEPGEQRSLFVSEILETLQQEDFRGAVRINASLPVAVTALRTRNGLAVSSLAFGSTQW